MAQYRLLARSYVGGAIRDAGEIVEWDRRGGHASWNLEPLDPAERDEWEKRQADPEKVADAEEKARGFYPQPGANPAYTTVFGQERQ